MTVFAHPRARIIVFAREPVPGKVKTRLQPALGRTGALALYRALLARLGRRLTAATLAPWELWVSSNQDHEDFITICNKKDINLQSGADLGARMDHASATVLARDGVDRVLLIGCDCPLLDGDYLGRALVALSQADVVLGPAEDGGYVLIGMKRPQPALFRDVAWGTGRVLAQTRAHIAAAGLTAELLEPLWDVDRPEDLGRLAALDPAMEALVESGKQAGA